MTHPAIRELLEKLGRHPALAELARRLLSGSPARSALAGLTTTAKALYLVLLWRAVQRPMIVVTGGARQAESLHEAIETFFNLLAGGRMARPQLLPDLDVLPFQNLSPHAEISQQRARALWRLACEPPSLTVASMGAALFRTEPPDFYGQLALQLRVGEQVPLEDLIAHLESIGYCRREPVEMVGEYSVRGGILDVFPPESPRPLRVEFFGDQIESMRRFDVETQRSVLKVEEAALLPLAEYPRSAALFEQLRFDTGYAEEPGWEFRVPLVRPRHHTIFSLTRDPVVIWDEPELLEASSRRLWSRLEDPGRQHPCPPELNYLRWQELQEAVNALSCVELRELEMDAGDLRIPSREPMRFQGNMQVAIAEVRTLIEQGARVVFIVPSAGEIERLADIFQEYSIPFQPALEADQDTPPYLAERAYMAGPAASTFLVKGSIRRGAVLPEARLALFGSDDLFGSSELLARPPAGKRSLATFTAGLEGLKTGDYVVHAEHGVGRFLGLREMGQGELRGDFMLLEYAGGAKLYVPLTRMDLVQRYRGAGDAAPALDRLGGATWARTKSRVKAKLRDMADELLKLYAERKLAEGFAFSPDSNWQREFEDAFEFTPTPDQLAAVRDIKRDMESRGVMDRLLCGDVGYGKTEVAMRAAFKALADGKQVAVLAPTTVLAFQHYETFKRRFAPFPVRIEMVSRFRSAKEIQAVLADLAGGKVDILIGTHRLLSKDVVFGDLGLLVIDEEQRFGVRHKERLKQLKKNVDVLTMSATPIPRTLHMALAGIRDLSVIETPPKDRLAIHTVVARFDPELIRAAIEQELARGGQVYFLHNRVDTIWSRASLIQQLAPQARIGVGHGQMPEAELERVMLGFMQHQFDVLVSTTIIENGLDIPLANTIVVDGAERYGLSELYQLRGRVGRSNRRAYAYLLIPNDTELSELARKRLAALKEFSELGAGFKIAALDLELRGAGNLLGGEQHGHISAVGFDMYVRLLEETVQELKGEPLPVEVRSNLNLGLDLRIPSDYIEDEHQRLRAYKQIAEAGDAGRAERLLAEFEDRYGPPPESVHTLLRYSRLKSLAERLGIEAVERRHGMLNIKFHKESRIDPRRLMDVVAAQAGAQFTPAGILRLPLNGDSGAAAVLERLESSLQVLAK